MKSGGRGKAVATLAIGSSGEAMLALTGSLMRRYAERVGADFVVFDESRFADTLQRATFEKFQISGVLGRYERVLFLDADVIVLPSAPNVFEMVPEGHLGVVPEEEYDAVPRHKTVTQEVLGKVDWRLPYFNSGVLVLDQSHRDLFDVESKALRLWASGERLRHHDLSDQPYLNHRVNALSLPATILDHRWNHTWTHGGRHRRFSSHFIHYAGPSGHRYGDKLDQIASDCEIASSPLALRVARAAPTLRWLFDRMNPAFVQYLLTEKLRAKQGA